MKNCRHNYYVRDTNICFYCPGQTSIDLASFHSPGFPPSYPIDYCSNKMRCFQLSQFCHAIKMTRETNERLLAAVQRGSAEEVRGILKSREPADWYAALKLSISQNRLEIVQILLQYGADPNHAYEGGMTPLILAVMNGNREIIENLIRARARVGDADSRGLTALHHACYSNTPEYEDIAAILLKAGAGYDRADQMGDTPLHIAASKGCVGLVVLLVSAGATMNRSNARGKTPLEVAVDARLSQVAETLLRAGSPFSSKLRTELEEMFGKEDLQKILASTPAAKEDARRRAEHTQELFEQFRVSFTVSAREGGGGIEPIDTNSLHKYHDRNRGNGAKRSSRFAGARTLESKNMGRSLRESTGRGC